MSVSFDLDTEILHIGKFAFKHRCTLSNDSALVNVFVCGDDESLCEFDCYAIPFTLPSWVSMEDNIIEDLHEFTILWSHPDLRRLWKDYLSAEMDEDSQSCEVDPEKFRLVDPEDRFYDLLLELGFIIDSQVEWGSPSLICYQAPDDLPNWIRAATNSIKPDYHCTIYWNHPDLSRLWTEHLSEFDWFESSAEDIFDPFDPEVWLKDLLWNLEFDGIEDFHWYFISQYFPSTEEILETRNWIQQQKDYTVNSTE